MKGSCDNEHDVVYHETVRAVVHEGSQWLVRLQEAPSHSMLSCRIPCAVLAQQVEAILENSARITRPPS